MKKCFCIIPLFLFCFFSCNGLQEAQEVVAEADSLRADGVMYVDSQRIAAAVSALKPMRIFYPTDYAKANYYYGRLLRNREDYVAAMQCFVDATETCTNNREIIAHAYTNIAIMCSENKEYALSQNFYTSSLHEFERLNDTVACIYALNSIAYEMVCKGEYDSAQHILDSLFIHNTYIQCNNKLLQTQAILFKHKRLFDKAIHCVNSISDSCIEPTDLLIKAQSFDDLGMRDSAIYYAQIVINSSKYIGDKYNMMYIMQHTDSTIDIDSVNIIAARRADIQMMYTDKQNNLSKAVMLLNEHKANRPIIFRRKLVSYISVGVLLALLSLTLIYRKTIIAKFNKEQKKYGELKRKNDKLIIESDIQQQANKERLLANCSALKANVNFKQEVHWSNYQSMCSIVNTLLFGIVDKLKAYNLNESEMKICILELIGFSDKEKISLMNYASSGFGSLKDDASKKIGKNERFLRSFLIKMAINAL